MATPAGQEQTHYNKGLSCPTLSEPPIGIIGENSELPNLDLNKNAATSAKVNGVKDVFEGVCFCGECIAIFPILATHWGALV